MQAVFGSSYGSEHGNLRSKSVVDIGHLTWANMCFYYVCHPPQKKNRPVPKLSLNGTRTSLVETTEKNSHFQAADLLADTERALGWLFAPMKGRAFTRKKWGVRVLSTNEHWACNKNSRVANLCKCWVDVIVLNYLRSNVLKKWDPTSNEWLFNTLWSSKPSKGPSNVKGKLSTKGAWGLSIMERPLNQPEDLTCCEFWKLSIPRLKTKLLGNRSRYIQIQPTLRTWLFHKGSWIHLPTKSESEWWFKNRTYVASLSRGIPTKDEKTHQIRHDKRWNYTCYCLAQY